MSLTATEGSARATGAPAYPPTVAAAIMTAACGQATMPAAAKVATEMAESTKDSAFFKPFIAFMSRIPQSENSARRTIPRPPLK